METWCDDLHNHSGAVGDHKLFSRERQGKRGGGVALYVKDYFDCMGLDDGDDRVGCLSRGKPSRLVS